MPTILERVTKVTAARLGAKEEAVVPSSNFTDDLGADSLDLVELIMGLEEEFGTPEKPVKIPDEDAAKIKTVQDAVDYLKAKGITDADVKAPSTPATSPAANTVSTPPKPGAKAAPAEAAKQAAPAAKSTPKSAKTVKNIKAK